MKKNKILGYIILIVFFFANGCQFLDYDEEDWFTEEENYMTVDRFRENLTNIYAQLPTGFNEIGGSMRSSASDDAEEANNLALIQSMNDGRWNSNQIIDAQWLDLYKGIRLSNLLLKNYNLSILDDRRYNDDYEQMVEEMKVIDDQARFLRAYFYFELMRRYGGVPLLNDEVLTLDQVNNVQHNSAEEVKNYIVQECDAIVDNLPNHYGEIYGMKEADNKGRATKGAVMALKARTLLYFASPLFGSTQDKWAKAAAASYSIIQMGKYSLDNNYNAVVNNTNSKELILGRRHLASSSFEASNFPVGYEGSLPGTCPTQNLVDTYEMTNGLDIYEPGSGYDPQNPYVGRDPRFLKTIIVNNSVWKGRPVEMWFGGLDASPKPRATKTGYYLKKYVNENVSLDPNAPSTAFHLWVFFRYSEILLNYAEAMNEAYDPTSNGPGYTMTAYDAVNQIRKRAGMPVLNTGMSKDEFRQELMDERRVELAFEDHRFWDIRRWMIGDKTTDIKGIQVVKNQDLSFLYKVISVETRTWNSKMYFYPIPQSELFKNDNLKQNIGW